MLTGKNLVALMAAILNNFKIDDPGMYFRETNRGHPISTCMHVMTNFLTPFQDQDSIGIPEFLGSGRKSWTLDSGRSTLDAKLWTLDSGRWTLDAGR